MFFSKDKREEVKAAHPDWSITDIGRELGAMWKRSSDSEKKVYQAQAEKDKQRYEKVCCCLAVSLYSMTVCCLGVLCQYGLVLFGC